MVQADVRQCLLSSSLGLEEYDLDVERRRGRQAPTVRLPLVGARAKGITPRTEFPVAKATLHGTLW
jgi:hypothetical protein